MCGVAGALVFNESAFSLNEDFLTRMNNTMIHRGPDGDGVWINEDKKIGLAHRRLSIIDISNNAAQPMSTIDGRYHISFNGEIYNHMAIRQELIQLGDTKWKTDHSDTEVILHAFAHWGIDCLEKFRGMFAFALWDNVKKELWLVRDRIGIKPLYYSIHHGRLIFASEIKALLTDAELPRAVNEKALYHFLTFITTPAPETLFNGIKKIPAGHWLRINLQGKIEEKQYWDVLNHTTPLTNVDEKEIAERVLSELRTAVSLRKVADVPIGVFLSGGIDSSTNAALFSEGETRPIKTFSIGYHGEYKSYKNELHYARMVADKIGAEHHEQLLSVDDLIDFLPTMVKLQDEPIADPVCVPVYYVSKLARDNGVTICQVGEGADELFWGYPTWKLKHRLQRLANTPGTQWLQKIGAHLLSGTSQKYSAGYEALQRAVNKQPIFWGGVDAFTATQKNTLLSNRLQNQFANYSSWDALAPYWKNFQENCWDPSILHWMSYVDLKVRLPELLLMRVDKMSMGVSLEGRVPFLDHKFVELAMSIPSDLKTKNGQLKYILKKAVSGVIPDEIIHRPKQGFGVPVYEWFFDRLGPQMRSTLQRFCKETDYLDYKAVQNILDKKQTSKAWYLYNLALWWEEHFT